MKLLRLLIEDKKGFRSLQQGFQISFHSLDENENMEQFRPFCFAGLNGSGKSNVMEAIAHVFYHLEICVARYLPESIRNPKNFRRSECTPNAFTFEYLIGQNSRKAYSVKFFDKVTITKKENEEPKLFIQPYPFDDTVEKREVSLTPSVNRNEPAEGKQYLPDHIVGYSSGENEILSLPFIKSRLIHLDEYKQATRDNYEKYNEPENSLVYIDNNMSQAVLLTCLLFENSETLAPLRDVDNTGILGLRSFRINIHTHNFVFDNEKSKKLSVLPILNLIDQYQLNALKKCATSWFIDQKTKILWLDFYVNEATKQAFKTHFHNSLKCFQFFQLLYELNSHFIDEQTKEEVYRSKGIYTDGKLPVGSKQQDVFHFLDFYITKELKKSGEIKELLLRSFSDGEHQFIHTIGICLLLNNKRSILLLDEPETHFNPSWRAKFVKILSDSISAGNIEQRSDNSFNVHLLKDILLTSHSPFIISDCLPNNVVLFEKDEKGNTTALKASELGIDTYGTSVNLITNRIFKNKSTIGTYALSKLTEFKKRFDKSDRTDELIEELNNEFGDSIEKLMLINEVKGE